MTTKEQLAAQLDGIKHNEDPSKELTAEAIIDGLVIVYWREHEGNYILSFIGATYGDALLNDSKLVVINKKGKVITKSDCDNEECPYHAEMLEAGIPIEVVHTRNDKKSKFHWSLKTRIPHAPFTIVDECDVILMGMVFALLDLQSTPVGEVKELDTLTPRERTERYLGWLRLNETIIEGNTTPEYVDCIGMAKKHFFMSHSARDNMLLASESLAALQATIRSIKGSSDECDFDIIQSVREGDLIPQWMHEGFGSKYAHLFGL